MNGSLWGYQGPPGGPRDPATLGGYCLARCYCACCPQYVPLPEPEPLPVDPYAAQALAVGTRLWRARELPEAPPEATDWTEPLTRDEAVARAREVGRPAPTLYLQRSGWWQVYAAVVRGARTPRAVEAVTGVPAELAARRMPDLVAAGLLRLEQTYRGREVVPVPGRPSRNPSGASLWATRVRKG